MARFILDIQEEVGIAMLLVEHDMGSSWASPTASSCSSA